MKKTLLALLLVPTLMLGACSNGGETTTTPTPTPSSTSTTPTSTPQPEYKSIAVSTFPKVDYIQGEQFTVQGGKLTVTRGDDTTYPVDMTLDMVPDKPNMSIIGEDIEVNVSYLNLSCKYYINIAPLTPQKDTPQIFVYDHGVSVTDGYVFKQSTGVDITVEVPTGVQYTVEYYQGETKLSAVPTDAGAYKLKVITVENDDYYAATKEISFFIKAVPTLVLKANGVALEGGEVFYLSDGTPTITCDCDYAGVQVDIYYTKDDGDKTIDLGGDFPTEAGTYAVNAKADATTTTEEAHVWKVIRVEMVRKVKPTIQFSWNGTQLDLSTSHWIGGDFSHSKFTKEEFKSKISYAFYDGDNVIESLSHTVVFEVNEVPTEATIDDLLPDTTYAMKITTVETADYESAVQWVLVHIIAPSTKTKPVIQFSWNGTSLDLSTSHWIGEGYGDSQFTKEEFKSKISYAFYDGDNVIESLAHTVVFEVDEVPTDLTIDQLQPNTTYAMKITTVETADYESAVQWVLVHIIAE